MKYKVASIEPVLFILMLNLFLMMPVNQQLVYQKVCLNYYNVSICKALGNAINESAKENVVQAETAKWNMYFTLSNSLPGIMSTLYFGSLSDKVGRRSILIIAVVGETLCAISTLINSVYMYAPIAYLFFGSLVSGVCGNVPAILMSVFAYIADITTTEERTRRITILDSLIFLAGFISNLIGGIMLQKFGFSSVYGVSVVLYVTVMIYIVFFLQESYHPDELITMKIIFSGFKIMESIKLLTRKGSQYYRTKMYLFVISFFVLFFQIIGIDSVTVLYLLHKPLHFQPKDIGYFKAVGNVVKFLGALFITVILIKRLKWRDSSLILICSLMASGYALCMGLSKTYWMVYLSTLLGAGLGVGNGACRSGLSKLVGAKEQGKMCSIIAIIQVVSILIAEIVCNIIYEATVHINPSITFFAISVFTLSSISVSLILKAYERKSDTNVLNVPDDLPLLVDNMEDDGDAFQLVEKSDSE